MCLSCVYVFIKTNGHLSQVIKSVWFCLWRFTCPVTLSYVNTCILVIKYEWVYYSTSDKCPKHTHYCVYEVGSCYL